MSDYDWRAVPAKDFKTDDIFLDDRDEPMFVTAASSSPQGADAQILSNRTRLYSQARSRNPGRWSRSIRDWSRVETVRLNPARSPNAEAAA
jgi:hypothetical protein